MGLAFDLCDIRKDIGLNGMQVVDNLFEREFESGCDASPRSICPSSWNR